jgi:polar amino acid transport system permease protein
MNDLNLQYLLDTTRYLMDGALFSLQLFSVTLLLSIPLSLIIAALYRFVLPLRPLIRLYTLLLRGTPLMLQLFFIMFGLPALGYRVDRVSVAYVGFTINYAAYFVEIIRAGLEAIPKDQEESAFVIGASAPRTYWSILMPQALRMQAPVFTNEMITLIKDTSLVTVIAISDILRRVREVVSRDFTISPFFLAAIFYLVVSYVIVEIMKRVEKKFDF